MTERDDTDRVAGHEWTEGPDIVIADVLIGLTVLAIVVWMVGRAEGWW